MDWFSWMDPTGAASPSWMPSSWANPASSDVWNPPPPQELGDTPASTPTNAPMSLAPPSPGGAVTGASGGMTNDKVANMLNALKGMVAPKPPDVLKPAAPHIPNVAPPRPTHAPGGGLQNLMALLAAQGVSPQEFRMGSQLGSLLMRR